MKIKDLTRVYVYSPIAEKVDGETSVRWQYKDSYLVNIQQDINELDITSAGEIDSTRIKIRIDYPINIEKRDGISLSELTLEDGYTTTPPAFVVMADPKIGRATTYTCVLYYGE